MKREETTVPRPPYRYLRGYALDPGFSTRLDTAAISEVCYRIPFEEVEPGPIGEYVAVMDFDPASDCWYEPVDLSNERVASQQGLAPSEGNPQFHQQFVYAVAMKTIRHFERALGRRINWHGPRSTPKNDGFIRQLRIYPHAMREANAYYDSQKRALLFGYFTAADQYQGANYPGGIVFTCLSPDIVAHEMTHAILDALHPRYLENTNADVPAFHEGFADIVALLQRFTFRDLIEDQLFKTGGRLDKFSVLGELATQFGEALQGNRGALRHMIGRWVKKADGTQEWERIQPDPADYQKNVEAHDRGAVLVATVFDAFQRVYDFRSRDLLRIATGGTGVLPEGSINRDLVRRLAAEACQIAEHLLLICIRALDYCPPHDISFGDYLRALITADIDAAPADENGFRVALIEAFRARGIFPDRVTTLSIESLRWSSPDFTPAEHRALSWIVDQIKPLVRLVIEAEDRHEIFRYSRRARAQLHDLIWKNANKLPPSVRERFFNKLGLTSKPVSQLFGADSKNVRFTRQGKPDNAYVPLIEIHLLRPAFREGRETGQRIEQIIISLTQRVTMDVGTKDKPQEMVFRGGCQLVLELGKSNTVSFAVRMNVKSYERFERQRRYLLGETGGPSSSASLYADDSRERNINFNLLHQH
ncbi:MAG: hypothetical protein WCE79_07460 [Xanthobacteraceae bacterium]